MFQSQTMQWDLNSTRPQVVELSSKAPKITKSEMVAALKCLRSPTILGFPGKFKAIRLILDLVRCQDDMG
jgi:hypothetical protein